MADPILLSSLGTILVAAGLAAVLTRRLNVPTIVAYLGVGLLLGPATGVLSPDEAVAVISEVGIALLLFLVGLELSIPKIKGVGGVAMAAGIGQVVFTAAGGFGLAWLLGFDTMESIFLATALTFSSTVVVVKLLSQKRELDSLYGRIAVGIFLVQDLVVIVVLTFLAGLGDPETLTPSGLAGSLGLAFGGMLLLLAGALGTARSVLPRVFGWASASPETIFIWSLCWLFIFVLAAEAMHLSPEIGAFLAGISLAQLPYNHDLRRRVQPLTNFFLAVFFVSLGVQMQLGAAQQYAGAALVLSLFVLIGNPLIFMVIIARMGYSERTSFLTSVTVAQISEFSFIFAAVGLAAGLIDESILSLIAVVGIVTIAASSYMILYNHELYAWFERRGLLRVFRARAEAAPDIAAAADEGAGGEASAAGHIVVVGMNTLGRTLVQRLAESGEDVVAVDTDPAKLAGLPARTIIGDVQYPAVLEEAKLADAKLLVSTLRIEDTNNLLAYHAVKLGVPSSVHAFERSVVTDLREIGVNHLMISSNDGIRRILREVARHGMLP
jgi:Kef-type K+ transport system membrane component KefB